MKCQWALMCCSGMLGHQEASVRGAAVTLRLAVRSCPLLMQASSTTDDAGLELDKEGLTVLLRRVWAPGSSCARCCGGAAACRQVLSTALVPHLSASWTPPAVTLGQQSPKAWAARTAMHTSSDARQILKAHACACCACDTVAGNAGVRLLC